MKKPTQHKTGKPPELMQDDCRKLSLWLSTRLDARWRFVRMMKDRK